MKLLLSITVAILIVGACATGQTVTGTGPVNYVPKFSSASTIASSLIYDNGTNVGIGTATPSYKFDVNGSIRGYSSANLDLSAHGAGSTVYIRSSYYNRINNFGALTTVNDAANGSSLGYVDNFTIGWTGYSTLNRTTGFTTGAYDVFVRIRTDGAGSSPTACTFGIYNGTTTTYPIMTTLTGLSTTYQEVYAGRFIITASMLVQNLKTYFSAGGVTTNYYLDYLKVVPSPIFSGSNVIIGSTADNGTGKLQVTGDIYTNSKVLIGTSGLNTGAYSLAVNGWALFTKAVVKLNTVWPDYVLAPGYNLLPLNKLEAFVLKNQHLPDVPSVAEVEKNGIDLGDNQAVLLRKIEELTLYMIELNKKVESLSEENKSLKKSVTSNQ